MLGKRFPVFPQPERSEEEWAEWWAGYTEALEGLARPALEAAMSAYVKLPDSEFFPKPGRIRELARTAPNPAELAFWKATNAVRQADSDTQVLAAGGTLYGEPIPKAEFRKPPAPSVEEREAKRAEFKKMVNETLAALTPEKPRRPTFHPPQGKVDETGITPEMRELIRRRSGESVYSPNPDEAV